MRQKSLNNLFLFVFCLLGFLEQSYAICKLDWTGAGQALTATVTTGYFQLPIQVTRYDDLVLPKCNGPATSYYFNIRDTYNNGNVTKYLYLDGIQTSDPMKRIEVVLYKEDQISIITSNNPVVGSVGNQASLFSYYAYINPALDLSTLVPGQYFGTYGITLSRFNNGNIDNSADKSQNITLYFNVQPANPVLDVSLLPSGSTTFNISATTYTLEFLPTLSEGAERDFNVGIQYNTKYKIGFKSPTNLGKLKNTAGAATIDYEMNVNNTGYFTLESENFPAVAMDTSVGVNQPTVNKYFNVKVRIKNVVGNVAGKPSGTYSDRVTISITSAN